jgi:RHS repeat-associated protein
VRILLTLGLLLAAVTGQAIERVTYYHNDALGSPVAATDRNGTLLWRESYAPYGERLTHEASGKDTVWYTGKQEEAAFGLNYFGARWYDPKIGRFMGVDPAGFSADNIQSFNRYAYANNNPYGYVDPNGKWALKVIKLAIKGGDFASTFAGVISDSQTLVDSDAPTGDRVWAGVSLASELLPLSLGD